jgi:CheY-like chemotaxis protein
MFEQNADALSGLAVLIAEDEPAVAMEFETLVAQLGCHEVHCASRLPDALNVVSMRPDLAILDVNLAGEMVFPVAERLASLGTPLLLVTGYSSSAIPKKWLPHVVRKPYDPAEIAFLLARLAGRARGRAA